jgi:hypothetical protein
MTATNRLRWFARVFVAAVFAGLVALIAGNLRSLSEGLVYVRQMMAWNPQPHRPIERLGPFGMCYELVGFDSVGRFQAIARWVRDLGLEPLQVPVPNDSLPNLLVLFNERGPYTLFVAHYDKSYETATYQGASDNTAAVCALLAAAGDLARHRPTRPVALLFTATEERGLKGAQAFLAWAKGYELDITEIINFDMIGRGRLAIRPSALPGFYFWLPGFDDMVYDGRKFFRGQPYPLPDPGLTQRLRALMGDDVVVYQRFTVLSDSNVFQQAGIPTVCISSDNMYYLDLVWERDTDRIELLDEDNLELARRLVIGYAGQAS